jgi:broad specificity phosphatase PhoE
VSEPALLLHPRKPIEVFLILHEQANRPAALEYEYMTGALRAELERRAFGRALTQKGERRARTLGRRLSGLGVAFILTESFVTPLETARLLARSAGGSATIPVVTDTRIRESDLSYLTRRRFLALGKTEAAGDANAGIRDWMEQRPDDFAKLVDAHVSLWNEVVVTNPSRKFALVLHVEGILLYAALLLGAPPGRIASLHIPRGHPLHVRLFPHQPPLVSLGDESHWQSRPSMIFGQYN